MSAPAASPPRASLRDADELHGRWLAGNQAFLLAELGRVRRQLARYAASRSSAEAPADTRSTESAAAQDAQAEVELLRIAQQMPAPATLAFLCEGLELSPFERDVLLLCAGLELDPELAALCTQVLGRPQVTFGLALAALPAAHWSALSPARPLRHARLIDVGTADALTQSPLRIEERVLHFLTGVQSRDERLQAVLRRVPPPPAPAPGVQAARLSPSLHQAAMRVQELIGSALADEHDPEHPHEDSRPLPWLCGTDPLELRGVAAAACAELGLTLYSLRAADVPHGATERATLLALWRRELHLSEGALLLCCGDSDPPDQTRAAVAWLERVPGVTLIAGREPLGETSRPLLTVDVPRLGSGERLGLLRAYLTELPAAPRGQELSEDLLEQIAAQFRLGVAGIATATAQVRARLLQTARLRAVDGSAPTGAAAADARLDRGLELWEACRRQARLRLDELARRIEPHASWDDLVLPEPQRRMLQEVVIHQRHQAKVYERWGMAQKSGRGLGITSLFVGQSGTGKTLAAEVLARDLRLDLYHIDLSQIVSKYIGETEKNLRRVFDAAEQGGAVLLFDEADALFGKRSEVKDSHDRYANLEISYLLQRMEAYQGISVLTSNNRSALDSAFLRRIRFIVQFPFPDPQQRAELWRRAFGPGVPTAGLLFDRLARLNVTGGQIRNIALSAAFLAADEDHPVAMRHILQSARSEYAKSDRPLTEAEIGGWV